MRRNRLVAIALAVTVLAGLTTAGLDSAAAVPATPEIFFAPGGDLVDGQTILVGGTGFDPSAPLVVEECGGDCRQLPFTAPVLSNGIFGGVVTVLRAMTADDTQVDCAVWYCYLRVSQPSVSSAKVWVVLPFGPRPTVSISPQTDLVEGQTVTVTGRDLAPGQTVNVMECQQAYGLCTKQLNQSAVVDADGRVALDVQPARSIPEYMDREPLDCAITHCDLALTLNGNYYEDKYRVLAKTKLNFAPEPAFLAFSNPYLREGDVGLTSVLVWFKLSPEGNRRRQVRYRTLAWSAQQDDFEPVVGRVWIAAGETEGTVTVNIRGDTLVERDEEFFVELRGTGSARRAHAIAVVRIVNDD